MVIVMPFNEEYIQGRAVSCIDTLQVRLCSIPCTAIFIPSKCIHDLLESVVSEISQTSDLAEMPDSVSE